VPYTDTVSQWEGGVNPKMVNVINEQPVLRYPNGSCLNKSDIK
jgi:hypothetical protein